jgi:predicted small lipoprotein YifL
MPMPIHAHLAILRPMNTLLRIALTALVFTGLAACGAKGPLVLPEKAEPVEVPAEDAAIEADAEAAPEDAEEQAEDAVDTPVTTPDENG